MINVARIAVSLPKTQYRHIETLRKKLHLSRSAIFQKALSAWIGSLEEQGKIERYIQGYRRRPEGPRELAEIEATAESSAAALESEHLGWE